MVMKVLLLVICDDILVFRDADKIIACYISAPGTSSICMLLFFFKQKGQSYALSSKLLDYFIYTIYVLLYVGLKIMVNSYRLSPSHLFAQVSKERRSYQFSIPFKSDICILPISNFQLIAIPSCETILRTLPVMICFNVHVSPNDSLALRCSLSRSLPFEIFPNISKSYENSKATEHGSLTWDE